MPFVGSVNVPAQCGTVLSVASGVAPPMLVNCGVPASPMTGSVVGGGVAAYALVARSAVIAMNARERARCRYTRYLPIWRTARAVASTVGSLDRKGPPTCEQAEGPR